MGYRHPSLWLHASTHASMHALFQTENGEVGTFPALLKRRGGVSNDVSLKLRITELFFPQRLPGRQGSV